MSWSISEKLDPGQRHLGKGLSIDALERAREAAVSPRLAPPSPPLLPSTETLLSISLLLFDRILDTIHTEGQPPAILAVFFWSLALFGCPSPASRSVKARLILRAAHPPSLSRKA
jgi:hypothetical protein